MPISRERYAKHVEEWSQKAGKKYWPQFLFHYADATAAAKALRDRTLLCRASQAELVCDVAEPGALATNPQALRYVRLHFRPLNHFNLSTEGIKFRDDPYRRERHMSIPVALLLDAGEVLTKEGVGFSGRKLAHIGQEAFFDEEGFDSINFEDVYHNSAPGNRVREINDRRTAEVVVPERLDLSHCIKYIFCRTIYDERTLRFLIGTEQNQLASKIRAAPTPTEFFFCWGTFIQLLDFSGDRLRIKLFQGRNYKAGKTVRCQIWQYSAGNPTLTADFEEAVNNQGVAVGPFHRDPHSIWKIKIEDVLAFHGVLPHQKSELIAPSNARR